MPLRAELVDVALGQRRPLPWALGQALPNPGPGQVLWLDVGAPDAPTLQGLGEALGLPRLVVEDLLHAHQRPKLERHGDQAFLVFYGFPDPDAAGEAGSEVEVALILGPSFVATVHHREAPFIEAAVDRLDACPELAGEAAAHLAYLMIDAAVDGYFPPLLAIDEAVDELEGKMMQGQGSLPLGTLTQLKRRTLHLRRHVTPLRDAFLVLMRGPNSPFGPLTSPYYQDILDHLLRVADALDLHRELLTGSTEISQNMASNRTNETMRQLTVISTVLMAVTLIAGVYGMNFVRMPELNSPMGYPTVLWGMLLVAYLVSLAFAWNRYLEPVPPTDQRHQRRTRFAELGALVLLGSGAWLGWAWAQHGHATRANFQSLPLGCAESLCLERLGPPDAGFAVEEDAQGLRHRLSWSHWRGAKLELEFVNGKLVRKAGELLP